MTEVLSAIRVPNRLSQFVHQPLETLILIRALIKPVETDLSANTTRTRNRRGGRQRL